MKNIFRFATKSLILIFVTAAATASILSALSAVSVTAFADDLSTEKKLSSEYLSKMSAEPDAQIIEQGIVIRPIFKSDSSKFAQATDTVRVSYHLVDREGKVLDESITADEIIEFPLNKLIKCWQIAIPKIAFGSFYKVSCSSDSAYGDKGTSDGLIKGGAALTFRLTVYGVKQ